MTTSTTDPTTLYRSDRIFARDTRYRRAHADWSSARAACDRSRAPRCIERSADGGCTWVVVTSDI